DEEPWVESARPADFPGTAGGAQSVHGGGRDDGFVARLNADLTEPAVGDELLDAVGIRVATDEAGERHATGTCHIRARGVRPPWSAVPDASALPPQPTRPRPHTARRRLTPTRSKLQRGSGPALEPSEEGKGYATDRFVPRTGDVRRRTHRLSGRMRAIRLLRN